jgi:enoyl-CoA hydratase/carnithine racemase
MSKGEVHVDRQAGVLVLTLDDAERRNVLSTTMRHALLDACRAVSSGEFEAAQAVVLTGANKAFSAGGDLSEMPPDSPQSAHERLAQIRELVELVSMSRLPWVAAVEGPAAGVACGLAAACDHVVAGVSARFLFPFARLGLVPDGGALFTVAERVGTHRAKNLFLRADPVPAAQALTLGLVDEVVEDGCALERALGVAHDLAQRAPGSVAALKDFYAGGPAGLSAALAYEADRQIQQYFSPELTEGISAFRERRAPDFSTTLDPSPHRTQEHS